MPTAVLSATDPAALTISDFETLVTAEVAESASLEFKSEPYSGDHEGTREFLKDVTSLANTNGGTLIIGVAETGGVASAVQPITEPDADRHRQRLESLLQSAVEPRLFGVRMAAVPHPDGGHLLVLRVPRSSQPPHRVTARNSNRFWLRSSAGAYEASMEELRALFGLAGDTRERLAAYRQKSLDDIQASRGPVPLALTSSDRLVVNIVPMSALGMPAAANLQWAYENNGLLRPIASEGFGPRFNPDGFANIRGGDPSHGYTQLFRDGKIEATKVGIMGTHQGKSVVVGPVLQDQLFKSIPDYLAALDGAEIAPPFFIMISLQHVGGALVACNRSADGFWEPPPPLHRDDLLLPTCVVQDFGAPADYRAAIKPALDALWNAGGWAEWAMVPPR